MHLLPDPIGEVMQPLRLLGCRRIMDVVDRRLQPEHQRRQVLPHLIVQLAGDPEALFLLGRDDPAQQGRARLLGPLALGDVLDDPHAAARLAPGIIEGRRPEADLDRGTVLLQAQRLVARMGPSLE